ncbi:unnamed protein product, partial [Tilletia controversa]
IVLASIIMPPPQTLRSKQPSDSRLFQAGLQGGGDDVARALSIEDLCQLWPSIFQGTFSR